MRVLPCGVQCPPHVQNPFGAPMVRCFLIRECGNGPPSYQLLMGDQNEKEDYKEPEKAVVLLSAVPDRRCVLLAPSWQKKKTITSVSPDEAEQMGHHDSISRQSLESVVDVFSKSRLSKEKG